MSKNKETYKGITITQNKIIVFPKTNNFEKLRKAIDKAEEKKISFNKHVVNSSL